MFYSELKGQGLHTLCNRDDLSQAASKKRSAPRTISRKFKNVLKPGEAPVYPDCLMAEQWEKSAETWRCRMRLATCLHSVSILKHLNPGWRFVALLTVWFSRWSERSPPVPRSRTSLRWRWLWPHLQRGTAQGHDPQAVTNQLQKQTEEWGRGSQFGRISDAYWPEESSFHDSARDGKKEMNETVEFPVHPCVILWLCWQQAGTSVVTKPFGLWPPGHPVHSLTHSLTHNGQRIFRLPCSHLRLSIRFAGQQYSRCFISVNPPS